MTAAGTVVVGLRLHFQPLPVAVVSVIVRKEGKTQTAYTVIAVVDVAEAAINRQTPLSTADSTRRTAAKWQSWLVLLRVSTGLVPRSFDKATQHYRPGVLSEALPEQHYRLPASFDFSAISIGDTAFRSPPLVCHAPIRTLGT
jgi:hypothetical protein